MLVTFDDMVRPLMSVNSGPDKIGRSMMKDLRADNLNIPNFVHSRGQHPFHDHFIKREGM